MAKKRSASPPRTPARKALDPPRIHDAESALAGGSAVAPHPHSPVRHRGPGDEVLGAPARVSPVNPNLGMSNGPQAGQRPGRRKGPPGNVPHAGRGPIGESNADRTAVTASATAQARGLRHNPPNTIAPTPRGSLVRPGTAPLVVSQYRADPRIQPQPYISDVDIDANWFCYSADTEVLTRRGWKFFADLAEDDEVATRNPESKEFEWQRPLARPVYDYVGTMYRFESQAIDLLVTPEHRMLVNSLPDKAAALLDVAKRGVHKAEEALIPARILAATATGNTRIPLTSVWRGEEIKQVEFVSDDPCHRKTILSGDDYCAFMGMFLAEGSTDRKNGKLARVKIAQSPRSGKLAWFTAALKRGFGERVKYRPYSDGRGGEFYIYSAPLARFCDQFGHAHQKFVPDDIMNATPRQLRLFWDAYMQGDGRQRRHKGVRGRQGRLRGLLQQVKTISPRMADQLQEIAQKLGYSASIRIAKAAQTMVRTGTGREYVVDSQREIYCVTLRRATHARVRISRQRYAGKVYCVSVPNRTVYVRRNRRNPGWSGNSPFQPI
jgi:hypothetical protein